MSWNKTAVRRVGIRHLKCFDCGGYNIIVNEMKLLIVACALCLVTSAVTGVFLGDSNDGLLGQLGEHFGGGEGQAGPAGQAGQVKPSGSRKGNGRQSDAPPAAGVIGEIETSLEQAAGVLDGLWRRFKKVSGLIGRAVAA